MQRDSTIFYRSFYEAIRELPKTAQADVYNAIFEFSLNFNEIELNGIAKTIFTLIKPQLVANQAKYKNGCITKDKQNRSKTEAKNKQTESKTEGNENEECLMRNENENENENDSFIKNVDFLYSIYPNACFVKNTSTNKSLKNKDKIKLLLKKYEFNKLKSIFETYISDCKKNKTYMKNFATFLNNIPDYNSMTFEQPKKLVKKLYVKYNFFYQVEKNKCFVTMEKWNEFYKNEDGINQIEYFSFEWREEVE